MLIDGIKKGEEYSPDIGQLVRFNIFKMLSTAFKEHFEADYQYYKDKTQIPSDGKISSFKSGLAKRIARKALGDLSGE